MSEPIVYRCIKDVIMEDGTQAFTEGREYTRANYNSNMIAFHNDTGRLHFVQGHDDDTEWLNEHFVKIDQA